MAPRSRAVKALQPALASDAYICLPCRRTLQRSTPTHSYASAATAPAIPSTPLDGPPPPPPPPKHLSKSESTAITPLLKPVYNLHAGLVLSRAPTLTRPLHPFERAFFLYQRRLNERLALPFTRYFYFKKGTPADLEWKRKMKDRQTPSRDIGPYNAYAKEGWDDEVRVGDQLGEELEEETRRRLVADIDGGEITAVAAEDTQAGVGAAPELLESGEKGAIKADEKDAGVDTLAVVQSRRNKAEVERPMDRITKADREGDMTSLDRQGWRTLYLLVKGKSGQWAFPSARLVGRENLKQGAERVLQQSAGQEMNTWIVGNAPVGHAVSTYTRLQEDAERGTRSLGEKIFYLKGRIMAGQANLTENKLGLTAFKWLTKEEVRDHVPSQYYAQVEPMLAER